MKVSDFDYILPESLIAQYPTTDREQSRLMIIDRETNEITHSQFYKLIDYLSAGDCLVLNNSKVIPARLIGEKHFTGGKVECLLIKRIEGDVWETLVKPGRRAKLGDKIIFKNDDIKSKSLIGEIVGYGLDGTRKIRFYYEGIFLNILETLGSMPLPPYINRKAETFDNSRYQTVYSTIHGSVAAPTAGLHFTKDILNEIKNKGISIGYVTLHVGIGTFRPVKVENVKDHHMHFEEYSIDENTANLINKTKAKGGKIVSVGTTSARTLESAAIYNSELKTYEIKPGSNNTDIFIYPGYEFKITDNLITNFHLPKSTLLMLISAFYNKKDVLKVYKIAIENEYRFFSYGDAMYIK